jgi:hypothetical protein
MEDVGMKAYPVFSDIQAMLRGCVYGQDATMTAAKYLLEATDEYTFHTPGNERLA